MKMRNILLITCLLSLFSLSTEAKTKVACIGNSITENLGLAEKEKYPAILQTYLGSDEYEVRNFGASGRTLLKNGDSPYWQDSKYTNALAWNPDIVIIKLGSNDSKVQNWDNYKDEFEADYIEFIESFKGLDSQPEIYVCYPIPAFKFAYGIRDEIISGEIIPIIEVVAAQTGAYVIDLYTPFLGKSGMVYDDVHPNAKGTTFMAYLIAHVLCPECNIPSLPEDYFLRIAPFDYTDKYVSVNTSSGIENNLDLIDNNAATSVIFPFEEECWISVALEEKVRITGYALTSGNTDPADCITSWKLQGSDDEMNWQDIDIQNDITFFPLETKVIEVAYTSLDVLYAFSYYRLVITDNKGGENVEIAEWQIFGFPDTLQKDITKNGGTITGQYAGYPGEGIENLIDGLLNKKYCVVDRKSGWVRYDSPEKIMLEKYTLTSCVNLFERNLKTWHLQGSNDGENWDNIDSRSNEDFMVKFNMVEFPVTTENAYSKFRLQILENNGGSAFQFAEWQLFGQEVNETGIDKNTFPENVSIHNGKVCIEAGEKLTYSIYDLRGKNILSGRAEQETVEISLPFTGIYIVKIYTYSGIEVIKAVL